VVNGARHPVAALERYRRPDVVDHLGLSDDECGFRARFELPEVRELADIGKDVQLLVGESVFRAHDPLRIADDVAAALQATG
jgi:hypothetical protein